ncbi:hypothetical protein [Hyphomonas johnsonii]|uniref:Flagellar protein FlgJ N-terminal domain-containing protein n=1 Tax=Hyphomonas johnsonii MHS-2 TaxID=1280950 RepID=A0A059FNK5_9PROT|nr:hypothetical protein [Hyphomonas johnsonii]KCZ92229.1 hypothetical protein HJO_09344 [Hyphomonas johnsonii MHS-2]
MPDPVSLASIGAPARALPDRSSADIQRQEATDIGKRFEQMLWADMLSHAGLEKALSQGGGEAASAFSRYVVEAVAKDLAETHPLGLTDSMNLGPSAGPAAEDAS